MRYAWDGVLICLSIQAKKSVKRTLKRKTRTEERYEVSRWVPLIQDIIEVS